MGAELICWALGFVTTGLLLGEGLPLPLDDQAWINWLLRGGVAGLSLLILWLIITGKLVPGYIHKAVVKENEQLKSQNQGMVAMGGAQCSDELAEHLKQDVDIYRKTLERVQKELDELRQQQKLKQELAQAKRMGIDARDSGQA